MLTLACVFFVLGLVGLLDDLVVLIVCVWMVIAFIEGYRVQLLQRI